MADNENAKPVLGLHQLLPQQERSLPCRNLVVVTPGLKKKPRCMLNRGLASRAFIILPSGVVMRLARATIARESDVTNREGVHTEAQLVDAVGALGQHLHRHLPMQTRSQLGS